MIYVLKPAIQTDDNGTPSGQSAQVAIYDIDGVYIAEVGGIPLGVDIAAYVGKIISRVKNHARRVTSKDEIDLLTGRIINKAVDPFAGTQEQIGILRDQIVRMLNGDMTASEDFKRLNEVAIKAIEAGQEKKATL